MAYIFEILLALSALSFSPAAMAGGGCSETSCSHSHVSTTGSNFNSPGCVAQFANDVCEGRPLNVDVNRCVTPDQLETWIPLDEKGAELAAGACAAESERELVDCNRFCHLHGARGGYCESRKLFCFNRWQKSARCRCV